MTAFFLKKLILMMIFWRLPVPDIVLPGSQLVKTCLLSRMAA
ncbi:MAG TPA: hypothetical protein VFK37_07420 [Bacillales bacterium]|nr:hypothetical protein [Bacillales bacterium]